MKRYKALRLTFYPALTVLVASALSTCGKPGIDAPLTVAGVKIQLSSVSRETSADPDTVILAVDVQVLSGERNTVANWEVWISDESGRESFSSLVGTMFDDSDKITGYRWVFLAAANSRSFILHLPEGKTINLEPLLSE